MYTLRKNGEIIDTGGSEIMDQFEDMITNWLSETSGWDACGAFYSVSYTPDAHDRWETFESKYLAEQLRITAGEWLALAYRDRLQLLRWVWGEWDTQELERREQAA